MRKILQVSSYPPPRAGWGVRVEYLKKQLEATGHRCAVLNIGASRRVPSPEYETVLGAADYVRKVWRFSRDGFVVHAHVNGKTWKGLVLSITAAVLNLVAGHRCFLTFHAGVDQDYFPREKSMMLRPVFWLLFTLPRTIICNNDAVKTKIAEYGIHPGKIVPIPAFSCQYLESEPMELPADLGDFYGRFDQVVVCYMRLRREFYPEATLDGFAALAERRSNVGLVICGTAGHSDPGLHDAVRRRLERTDVRDRVMLVDDLPHPVFVEALRRASVYLRTPPTDGVSSSVLEAVSLGLPVVASDNETRPASVVRYAAGSVRGLASALEQALDRAGLGLTAVDPRELPDTLSEEVALLTT